MSIRPLASEEISLLTLLVEQQKYKKYQYIRPVPSSAIQKYTLHRLEKDVQNGMVWVWEERAEPKAYLAVERLDWDSEILGFPCARMTEFFSAEPYAEGFRRAQELLREAYIWGKEAGIRFMDARVDARDLIWTHALEDIGFRTMETAILYAFARGAGELFEKPETNCEVRLANAKDLEFVQRVAETVFVWDRFHRDPRIPLEKAVLLYQKWVENAVLGKRGGAFIVEAEGRKLGFHTFAIDFEFNQFSDVKVAQMDLIAIIPHPRVKNVWETLIYEMVRQGLEYGISVGESRTQLFNLSAMWRLMRTPPPFSRIELTLHFWYE